MSAPQSTAPSTQLSAEPTDQGRSSPSSMSYIYMNPETPEVTFPEEPRPPSPVSWVYLHFYGVKASEKLTITLTAELDNEVRNDRYKAYPSLQALVNADVLKPGNVILSLNPSGLTPEMIPVAAIEKLTDLYLDWNNEGCKGDGLTLVLKEKNEGRASRWLLLTYDEWRKNK